MKFGQGMIRGEKRLSQKQKKQKKPTNHNNTTK